MDYAITGGAGFIGSNLAKLLLQQGHKEEYKDVNVNGTKNVFDTARETGTKVVFASSAGIYGNTDTVPTPESAEPKPANPYGATKFEAEIMAQKYGKEFDIVGLLYYNVYGNNPAISSSGVISRFYQNTIANKPPVIDGDGQQVRDFVFVDDVIHATISAMEKDTGSVFINIDSGTIVSILALANLFIKYSKKNFEPIFQKEPEGNVRASQADISLAKRLLGWKPETKLEEWVRLLFKI